jgi:hypothetical protein
LRSSFGKVFMGAAGGDVPSDDEFNRVSFLSHFEGSNNGVNNVFDDGSTSNHTITANGDATQGSFGPFARPDGEWGWSFDGNDYLSMPDSGDFELASGDFTVAAWLFPHVDGSGYQPVITHASHSGNAGWGIWYQANKLQFFVNNANTTVYITSGTFTANEWTHVAAVRTGNTIKLFINGDEDVSTSISDFTNSTTTLTIGASPNWNSTYYYTGIISNILVLKGTALYTGDFTPPTSKYTAITNTKLLTCQSNRFVDNSASGHAITPTGNPAVSTFGPFLTSAVYDAAVNGASSSPLDYQTYLSIADGSWKTLGTGNFTWEFWFYGKTESAYMIGDGTAGTNVSSTFTLGVSSKRLILYYSIQGGAAYALQSPNSAPFYNLNEWHHVAYVRDGNDHKIYANGVLRATETRSGTMVDSTGAQQIGNFGPGFSGGSATIFSDVRLVKGTAVYSGSTYTVPTAPLTAITNTQLLVNMANGQAIDSAAQSNLTLFGTAKLSTGQAKFGDTSILFDGNSDFLTFPHSSTNDISGAGNWTVEFFWRFVNNDATQFQEIATKGFGFQIYGNDGALSIALSASNNSSYFLSATGGTTLSDNTWYHIAAVKNGTAYNVYLNGTNEANLDGTSSSNVDTGTDPWCLGAMTSDSYYANGYMDEFRISRFARYTANFTAPAEPFADKGQ